MRKIKSKTISPISGDKIQVAIATDVIINGTLNFVKYSSHILPHHRITANFVETSTQASSQVRNRSIRLLETWLPKF
jgi:hypothetical protein